MRDFDPDCHFHAVAICRTCSDITVSGVFKDRAEVEAFCDRLMEEVGNGEADKRTGGTHIAGTCLLKYEAYVMTAGNDHDEGHDVVLVFHQCHYPYKYCMSKHSQYLARKLAQAMTRELFNGMNKKDSQSTKSNNMDDRATKILESLNLPDNLFDGMH